MSPVEQQINLDQATPRRGGAPAPDTFAPGLRVVIRDAEWVIKRADRTSNGEQSILGAGISELVRGREARFLTELDHIKPLHPEDTELVADSSSQFADTRLYIESLLRQSPPAGAGLWIGHRAAIDLLPYQLDPALQALKQIRCRILLADAVGLGKTIEAGILLAELIRRGKGKRILVVATKSMMTQWQKELWSRFTIPLVRLDRAGIERIRRHVPADANPFHYYDKSIISVDTLKQERDFRFHLDNSYWDIIVIDEAHNVAVRGSKSARAKLAELLAKRSDTLILASATPHDGRAESFASLMNMLNPTAIADRKNYGPGDIAGLFLRRFKKDVQEQIKSAVQDRITTRHPAPASRAEERAYELLANISFRSFDRAKHSGALLFRTGLEKALFSSPSACRKTIAERLRKLDGDVRPEAEHDREALKTFAAAVEAITPDSFSRYQTLLALLRKGGGLAWDPGRTDDRLVIFTERIETLRFLRDRLEKDLNLKPAQIATLDGQSADDKLLQETVEKFGRDQEHVRVLIATDIASEGLNLHFLSHKLIHFDIPWSLMKFQQRNGRVDRYGQPRRPHIAYLATESKNEKIRGDLRILELLTEKDEQAQKNIGDPSAFLGVYDEHLEEIETGKAIEASLTREQFERRMDATAGETDWLSILQGAAPPPRGEAAEAGKRQMPSLFSSDLDYFAAGLARNERMDFSIDRDREMVSFTIPKDLERTLKRALPEDALPEDGRLHLTADRKRVQQEIAKARAGERLWPEVCLLWDLNPAMEWLNYRLLVKFGRAQAPVVTLRGALGPREIVFLMQGEIPNRKGQAVVHSWFGVRFDCGSFKGIEELQAFLARTGLAKKCFSNPAADPNLNPAQTLLPEAIGYARRWMSEQRAKINSELTPELKATREKLDRLRAEQHRQLELEFQGENLAGIQLRRKQTRERGINCVFDDTTAYVQDTLTTEDAAFLRVAAVFLGA
ncbi:MAG TPA: DEAD/DEAH box helicase [Bryobacteraceae bacterium]